MPTYNAGRWLREAIESILSQTFTHFELIIIDDGSTDDSDQIIRSFTDPRIRSVRNERNSGLVAALNLGVSLCRGKYIARMDGDDRSHPARLEKQYRYLQTHPAVGLCGAWAKVVDEKDRPISRLVLQTDPRDVLIHLLFSVPLVHPACMIRAEILKNNPYHDVGAEDYDLWRRLSTSVTMTNLPEFLLQYRLHGNSVSAVHHSVQNANKWEIILQQLQNLHLTPTPAELRIHTLSFTLHSPRSSAAPNRLHASDLSSTRQWFNRLLIANRRFKKYDRRRFQAYLWARWITLCLAARKKRKFFSPPLATIHPLTLFHLGRQLLLLARK
jgi:glycosyltransferase involved in cell wall biosynthesis